MNKSRAEMMRERDTSKPIQWVDLVCEAGKPCGCRLIPVAEHQQDPVINTGPCIQDMVIADIEARKAVGIERYGTVLQPFNGRDVWMDLYQELLDACNYVRQAIYERDNAITVTPTD